MASESKSLRADLKSIVDEVSALRNAYVRLQSHMIDQERLLVRERNKSIKLQSRLKLAINTLLTLKRRFNAAWDKVQGEKGSLAENVSDLQRKCDQFRSHTISADHNDREQSDCVSKLVQESTQYAQLPFQGKNDFYKPAISDDVVTNSERNTIKLSTDDSSVFRAKRRRRRKPPPGDCTPVDSTSRAVDVKRRKSGSYFRWPSLNVTITGGKDARNEERNDGDDYDDFVGTEGATIGGDVCDGNGRTKDVEKGFDCITHRHTSNESSKKSLNKKRKLYSDDKEDAIDI